LLTSSFHSLHSQEDNKKTASVAKIDSNINKGQPSVARQGQQRQGKPKDLLLAEKAKINKNATCKRTPDTSDMVSNRQGMGLTTPRLQLLWWNN